MTTKPPEALSLIKRPTLSGRFIRHALTLVVWLGLTTPAPLGAQTPQLPGRPGNASSTYDQHGAPDASDNWRLVRTPNPAGGPDAVSVTQIADISVSDIGFAGLMLRCGEAETEALIVLVQPLPPRAHPNVTIETGLERTQFAATVVTPRVLLLLPSEAAALAAGKWQQTTKLTVTVESEHDRIHGVVPLTGLKDALLTLKANCLHRTP